VGFVTGCIAPAMVILLVVKLLDFFFFFLCAKSSMSCKKLAKVSLNAYIPKRMLTAPTDRMHL
jgi:hypothetical protein